MCGLWASTLRIRINRVVIEEELPGKNVERFRGGLVFKAHGLVYHSTLGLRVTKQHGQGRHLGADVAFACLHCCVNLLQGLGFMLQGSGFKIQNSGFRAQGLRFGA